MTFALLGRPYDENGVFLPSGAKSNPAPPLNTTEENAWHPFEDRIAFDWAHYHFVELQSSEAKINRGLDLWLAATIKAGSKNGVPWQNTDDMYATIDAIQQGNAPWKTIKLRYNGHMPPSPPKWMTESYELCVRDSRLVHLKQLATTDFDNNFHPAPYRQFNGKGDRVYTDLNSGDWTWDQAVRFYSLH